jgi:hypothetical protein
MQICEEKKKKKKALSSWMVGRRGRGPRRKPKAWGGRERRWLVGVAGVADLSSWCGASPVQRVVVSDLLQCVGVAASGWVCLRISSWCHGWASPVHSVVAMVEGGGGRGCWPCWWGGGGGGGEGRGGEV